MTVMTSADQPMGLERSRSIAAVFNTVFAFSRSSPQSMVAVTIVSAVVLVSILSFAAHVFGFSLTTYDPIKMNIIASLKPPTWDHWMGTDKIGRDTLARVVGGAWITISVSFGVLAVAAVIGTGVGIVAGFFGGLVDEVLMRMTDLFLAFPALILAAAIAATFGGGMGPTTVALAAVFWPWYARVIRSRVLSLKEQEFVSAARALGASRSYLLVVTLLPMVWPLVLVQLTSDVGFVMLASSGLSFLGLGAQPPAPEWGAMIFDSLAQQPRAWWLGVFPGAAIATVAIGFNLLGDSLRDYLDPSLGTGEVGI